MFHYDTKYLSKILRPWQWCQIGLFLKGCFLLKYPKYSAIFWNNITFYLTLLWPLFRQLCGEFGLLLFEHLVTLFIEIKHFPSVQSKSVPQLFFGIAENRSLNSLLTFKAILLSIKRRTVTRFFCKTIFHPKLRNTN